MSYPIHIDCKAPGGCSYIGRCNTNRWGCHSTDEIVASVTQDFTADVKRIMTAESSRAAPMSRLDAVALLRKQKDEYETLANSAAAEGDYDAHSLRMSQYAAVETCIEIVRAAIAPDPLDGSPELRRETVVFEAIKKHRHCSWGCDPTDTRCSCSKEAVAVCAALRVSPAAPEQRRVDGWQPIATMPNDDTLIIASCPPQAEFPNGRVMIWKASMLARNLKGPTPWHLQFPASHWMPLPPASRPDTTLDGRDGGVDG